jgi:hypothetical protein
MALPRGLALTILAAILLLSAPAAAHTATGPTRGERSAIERAARRAYGGPPFRVTVSKVAVSSAGPWATGVVALHRSGEPHPSQMIQETFYHRHGSPWVAGFSTAMPDREMPSAIRQELGLASSTSLLSILVPIYLIVCWFFGLVGTVDVALQPRSAFQAVGRSKLRWFAIELLGGVLFGIFTWAWYAIRVRPALVRAGGRPPRKLLNAWLELRREAAARRPSTPAAPPGAAGKGFEPATTCRQCGGSGQVDRPRCMRCGGSGRVPNPQHNPSVPYINCNACGGPGTGRMPCPSCGGRGR